MDSLLANFKNLFAKKTASAHDRESKIGTIRDNSAPVSINVDQSIHHHESQAKTPLGFYTGSDRHDLNFLATEKEHILAYISNEADRQSLATQVAAVIRQAPTDGWEIMLYEILSWESECAVEFLKDLHRLGACTLHTTEFPNGDSGVKIQLVGRPLVL